MISLAPSEDLVFCLLHSSLTAILVWQIFNLQFEALRRASTLMRLAASGLMFALICGTCLATSADPEPGHEWQQILILISLSCFVQRMRRSPASFGRSYAQTSS